jgi:hypothetical protein
VSRSGARIRLTVSNAGRPCEGGGGSRVIVF